jgi:hypothetical protein
MQARPDDWLIVAGDLAESETDIMFALGTPAARYARIIWVPGNHELWTIGRNDARGEHRYRRLVERCRAIGVTTPEDLYPIWQGEGGDHHFPIRREHANLPMIPGFCTWCGTRTSADWPQHYRASVVVSGHLHLRTSRVEAGVRYEEVSLGAPKRQWCPERGVDAHVRQILPASHPPEGVQWIR